MVSFESDYIQGAHPEILKKLSETNMETQTGYGYDRFSISAKEKIKKACGCEAAEVYFLMGGTQTNMIVIDTMLKSYEGVIAADTGHVSLHEAGAIEYSGHKVITVSQHEGKIDIGALRQYLGDFFSDSNFEHMSIPGMVYISHPTEYGTLYTLSELKELSEICREYSMPLYLDGARLSSALMSKSTDVTLRDIAALCDVFYIGGTKCGALCGEAAVFTKNNMPERFLTLVKQRGALAAKGRLLGVQFDTLFTDDLYFRLGKNAIDKAERMKKIFDEAGCEYYIRTDTNQQFIVLSNEEMEKLGKRAVFSFWEKLDDNHSVVRFATSWATTDDDLDELERIMIDG